MILLSVVSNSLYIYYTTKERKRQDLLPRLQEALGLRASVGQNPQAERLVD